MKWYLFYRCGLALASSNVKPHLKIDFYDTRSFTIGELQGDSNAKHSYCCMNWIHKWSSLASDAIIGFVVCWTLLFGSYCFGSLSVEVSRFLLTTQTLFPNFWKTRQEIRVRSLLKSFVFNIKLDDKVSDPLSIALFLLLQTNFCK